MSKLDHTEVLVVGAGPVGMFTALLLAESGVRVKLIDQESRTAGHSYACALHPRSLRLLQQAGLAADVLKLGHRIDTIAFCDGRPRRAELKLAQLQVDFPSVVVLPQSALENLLERRLSRIEHVEINWNCRLSDLKADDKGVVATIDKLTQTAKGYGVPEWDWVVEKTLSTSADFVVGADGSKSRVRQCLGIEFEQVGDPDDFVVYECGTKGTCGHEMQVVLGDTTTSVMWPLSDNRCRWSFRLTPADASSEFPEKDRSSFIIGESPGENDSQHRLQRLIHERAPWFEDKLGEVGWSTEVQFERRLARDFAPNRCCLAGDAAHQTSPVGMQSMNLGLREAADLAGKLGKILREKSSVDLLEAYNREHRAEWQQMLGVKAGLKPRGQTDAWIQQRCARMLTCIPASGDDLRQLVNQLGLDLVSLAPGSVH